MSAWKKVKIGDICKIEKGLTGIASAVPGEFPLVVTAVERKTCSTYQFDCDAVCIPLVSSSGHGKKSLNNVHFQSGKFALGTILCAVIPKNPHELDARYLHQYLQFYKDTVLVPLMKGAANVSLSMKDIAGVEVPLPPIEKQRELSAMFVSLQEKSLEFKKETGKQVEYVKLLRQSILQNAIEGKLTEDWRKQHSVQKGDPDYDAEALFDKIQAKKLEIKSTQKTATPIAKDEIPFEIPTGWKWVRLGDVGEIYRGSGIKRSDMVESGLPCVRYGELYTTYGLTFSDAKSFIKKNLFDKSKKFGSKSVIFTLTGENRQDIAKAAAYLGDNFVAASGDLAFWVNHSQEPCYLSFYMASLYFTNIKKKIATGDFIIHMSVEKIKKVPLPLPPLAEQKEIVARVEKYLETITQLETQIATRETLTKQLMQSILKDAFEE
ncbi:restriction endonuclease subunit S [Fibrobacter sp.]|uniref:restriction endonuclease subunit S n=1 Tax=Fibrobacter sp. TaxID=35828 RepID=UPI003867BD2F